MPAAAVASFTPEITGMSGTEVGASGETAVDMISILDSGERSIQNAEGRDKSPAFAIRQ
jgi:hypothetical protein